MRLHNHKQETRTPAMAEGRRAVAPCHTTHAMLGSTSQVKSDSSFSLAASLNVAGRLAIHEVLSGTHPMDDGSTYTCME